MGFLVVAVLIGLIPAFIAKSKGHGFLGWWFYGTAIFIIALPHSLLLKVDNQAIEAEKISDGMKKCPHCAELVKLEAKICRYCQKEFPQSDTQKCRKCNYQVNATEQVCPACRTIQ